MEQKRCLALNRAFSSFDQRVINGGFVQHHGCKYLYSLCVTSAAIFLWSLSGWATPGLVLLDNPLRRSFTGFASSVAVVGDLDGDQVPDYLIGAYEYHWNGSLNQGRAFVFSGRSGKVLFTLDNPSPRQDATRNPHHGPAFGSAVAAAGDVNRDGVPDVFVGAFNQESSGRAFVFSGKDGTLLYPVQAPQRQPGAGFGWAVASLGDLTGDEIPELVVGAFAQDGDGRAFVFNGRDGALLRTLAPAPVSRTTSAAGGREYRRAPGASRQPVLPPPPSGSAFGWSVAGAGDLDGDGVPDILVGAPYTSVGDMPVQGRVYAFRGRDGQRLYTLDDPTPRPGAVFGWHVAAGGDFNHDGVPDVLVGAPYKDVETSPAQGEAFVFSGADGTPLLSLHNPTPTKAYSGFGHAVAVSPDINQDGVPEILVGAPYQTVDQFHIQGEVFLFNGRDGRHLTTFDNPYPHQGSMFGYSVAVPGDIDGDGVPDIAIGAFGQSMLDKVAVGRVYVFLSRAERAEAVAEHMRSRKKTAFEGGGACAP
ncbi:MAG: integrin alpha [Thermodesulfobacteriota bacterium]